LNSPLTHGGWQVWNLTQRLGGQLRMVAGMGGAVTGWDMSAALALGIAPLAMAELLPAFEAVMVRKLNEQLVTGHD